ncbi:MAG: flagellar basal body P-ring formation protein FlgA [Alphaproteobacteria bacterium]|nr:flagellar basal body P-ring formation protein FlgA [Alphaproteobacteria bacterium]MCB9928756.1 flagellar basal body P-ring formation protein FlgA [Alphaproteobacteria bacterium]
MFGLTRRLAAPVLGLALVGWAAGALAGSQVLVPVRTIPAGAVIAAEDVALQPVRQPPAADTLQSPGAAIGKEAQRSLYANRPIREHDIGPITLVERNARVTLRFRQGGLDLTTVGRALDRGGLGTIIRVMNLDSRRTIYGRVSGPETVDVAS